jgi:stage II sporulation protein AA (anti-sigma F factor antagonist)
MDIKATRHDDAVVLEPAGMIDTRGALHFEREINVHFEQGIRRFAIDLGRVELITSAGIRVLVMLVKRVAGKGAVVLCGLNEHVTSVFDVAGLLQHFVIVAAVPDALARLREAAAPAAPPGSKVSRAALRLLNPDDTAEDDDAGHPRAAGGARSRLSAEVVALLRGADGAS